MHFDPLTLYVLAVIFFSTVIRSTLGFGEALVAVPLLALRIPVAVAVPLAVLVSVLVAAVIVVQDWRKIEVRSAAWLFAAALPGIPLGLFLLARANDHVVKLILGALIAIFSLYSLIFRARLHLEKDHLYGLLAAGFCSGFLGGAYGMNGPPLVIYGSLRRWSPQHFRATLQGYFLPASLLGLLGYAAQGLWTAEVTRYFLLSLPAAAAAIFIGRFLNRQLRGDAFFRLVFVGLIALGGILIAQGLLS
ncbi:MAG TPA: sulfite exporter TauE/SafE family protein [Pirellulales bacterium]|nr:sulfite exporter TauE/SafE family protein [Pirellulales bacterium]